MYPSQGCNRVVKTDKQIKLNLKEGGQVQNSGAPLGKVSIPDSLEYIIYISHAGTASSKHCVRQLPFFKFIDN